MQQDDIVERTLQCIEHIMSAPLPADPTAEFQKPATVFKAACLAIGYSNGLGEQRKGCKEPGWSHFYRAAKIGKLFGLPPGDLAILWLHDSIEDSQWKHMQIFQLLNTYIADGVQMMSIEKAYPDQPREEWVSEYHVKLAKAPAHIQTAKLIESLTNIWFIDRDMPRRAETYLMQKFNMFKMLDKAHPVVIDVYAHVLNEKLRKYS